MKFAKRHVALTLSLISALVVLAAPDDVRVVTASTEARTSSYIVQGDSAESVAAIVRNMGAEITHELGVIGAVAADLTESQIDALRGNDTIKHVYDNGSVEVAGQGGTGGGANQIMETHYSSIVNAVQVHDTGIVGAGVGIAILDTGLWKHNGIKYDSAGNTRISVVYDAISNQVATSPMSGDDPGGHGSHVASIAVSSLLSENDYHNGIAPGAHLISVRAFDEYGYGTYADVIRAIDWIVTHKNSFGVRVLNLSFSAEPRSYYWDDPINQAVMAAWQADIVVVAAAGNRGPDPMTIGVPGNVPYVITVGAMTDNYTPSMGHDDQLASFSSAGPTVEGFVKPEVVAPGGHMLGLMQGNSYLATTYPEFSFGSVGSTYFEMSGTSQATAVVSGLAALILQANPSLSADDVKCRIMSTARPATVTTGKGKNRTTNLAYSVFQQGAGMVDARNAINGQNSGCANNGLDIDADVAGTRHFGGRANVDGSSSYYLMGLEGYVWSGGYGWTNGYAWTDGYGWTNGLLWAEGYGWTDGQVDSNGYVWTDGYGWTNGYGWTQGYAWTNGYGWTNSLTEMASMSSWVEQE